MYGIDLFFRLQYSPEQLQQYVVDMKDKERKLVIVLYVSVSLLTVWRVSLRKHAYSNILKILQSKKGNYSDKKFWFHFSAQNIDCAYSSEPPYRGGSIAYHNVCFWPDHKKNNVYPCKPQFYYIKVGFNGVKII